MVWSGRGRERDDARGSLPLARLMPLAALPGVQVFSLQKGPAAAEQHSAGAAGFVVDLGAQCRHFGDKGIVAEKSNSKITVTQAVYERKELPFAGTEIQFR